MPTTYNGIGTHYYGKKNLQVRSGTCRSCGRQGQLESYDTRLWFVIVFIPIIPLGRKRILDSCPSCRRHYVTDLDKWETARQLEVSGAMEKYRSNPTPEGAIAAHHQMIGFHQIAEAAEFQKTMLAQYPDNAKILAYLGAAHEHMGRGDQAGDFYKRALALRPDMPEARMGVAREQIRVGRLDEARKLLDFLEKPGAEQLYSLELLETLGQAYQAGGRHQEALDLFNRIIQALPKVAEHAGFRKMVKKSEKALNRDATILPKQKFSLKRLFQDSGGGQLAGGRVWVALGVIAALVLLGFVISNEYIRRHRKLHLINAYDTPATVQISGADTVRNFRGMRTIDLPEGRFHAVISGPVKQEVDFEIRESYWSRWFSDPLWVINVGGAGLLQEVTALYSRQPPPPTVSFHTGETFERFAKVTHPFTSLPESIQVSSGETRTLVQLDLFKGQAAAVFDYYETKRSATEAMNFAERWLRVHPNDDRLLQLYAATATKQKQQSRGEAYLRSGLTNRPVNISWHRLYQAQCDHPAQHAALALDYDEMLRADPTNSALLYLRGRLETNRAAAHDYFQRSADADPHNPYPIFALGYDRAAAGDWAGAKPLLQRAASMDSHEARFAALLIMAELGLGEAPALEQESREKLKRDPLSYVHEFALIDSLAAQNKPEEAQKAANDFASLCQSRYGARGKSLADAVQYHTLYAIGDFQKLEAAAKNDHSARGRESLAQSLIEQDRLDEAVKELPADLGPEENQILWFAIAVAYRHAGNDSAAAQWRSRAIEHLQAGNGESVQTANLLKRGTPPTRDEVLNVVLPAQLKSLILTMLAQEFPQSRAELADLAQRLNPERVFPHHLVRRITPPTP